MRRRGFYLFLVIDVILFVVAFIGSLVFIDPVFKEFYTPFLEMFEPITSLAILDELQDKLGKFSTVIFYFSAIISYIVILKYLIKIIGKWVKLFKSKTSYEKNARFFTFEKRSYFKISLYFILFCMSCSIFILDIFKISIPFITDELIELGFINIRIKQTVFITSIFTSFLFLYFFLKNCIKSKKVKETKFIENRDLIKNSLFESILEKAAISKDEFILTQPIVITNPSNNSKSENPCLFRYSIKLNELFFSIENYTAIFFARGNFYFYTCLIDYVSKKIEKEELCFCKIEQITNVKSNIETIRINSGYKDIRKISIFTQSQQIYEFVLREKVVLGSKTYLELSEDENKIIKDLLKALSV